MFTFKRKRNPILTTVRLRLTLRVNVDSPGERGEKSKRVKHFGSVYQARQVQQAHVQVDRARIEPVCAVRVYTLPRPLPRLWPNLTDARARARVPPRLSNQAGKQQQPPLASVALAQKM